MSATQAWQSVSLEAVAQVFNGGTPRSGVAEYWDGDVQWLTPKDMGRMRSREIATTPRTITQAGLRNSSARLVPENSVILSTRAPIGHLAINTQPMAFNQGCRGMVPGDQLDHEFLYYFLLASRSELDGLGTGATFKELSAGALRTFEVPLPPLDEQKRIVAVLDQAFAALDRARANAETNLADGHELVAAAMEQLFPIDGTVTAGHSLSDLCEAIIDCEHRTAPTQVRGIPSIRTPNVGKGRLLLDGVNRVSEETYREWTRRAEPQPGDLILAREAPAGNVAVIPEGMRVCLGQRTVLLRPKKDLLIPAYLAHLLLVPSSQTRLLAHSRGATVQHINVKDIRAFKVSMLPSLSKQNAIVERIERLTAHGQSLADAYTSKRADITTLRQSLSQAAFSGQLT